MSFKKTVTFTASVSDYTDGTVSARVQAENKILGDLVAFILSHNLGISIQEKCEIGSSKWAGDPLWCSSSGATSEVNNDSKCTDVYFLGRGMNKKCLGFSVDHNEMYIGLCDTPTRDLEFSKISDSYGRLPCGQLRYLISPGDLINRRKFNGVISPISFSSSSDELSLSIKYWKKSDALVIIFENTTHLVITKDPCTVYYGFDSQNQYTGMHFSLDDDFIISEATYSFTANNQSFQSNYQLGYAMNYSPYFVRSRNYGTWEDTNLGNITTSIVCHRIGLASNIESYNRCPSPTNGLNSNEGCTPTVTAFMFPRIANNELYIKKFYVPMTYPAVASPLKIGYTPGKLNAENVYSLNGKNYVCLNNGVIGLFVEVEDQGD